MEEIIKFNEVSKFGVIKLQKRNSEFLYAKISCNIDDLMWSTTSSYSSIIIKLDKIII